VKTGTPFGSEDVVSIPKGLIDGSSDVFENIAGKDKVVCVDSPVEVARSKRGSRP
jgi:hypothetical protein